MKITDTRSLSKDSRSELRLRAVKAYLSTPGRNMGKIAELFSVRRQTLRKWINLHKETGAKSLSYDSRGAKKWQHTTLKFWQASAIKRLITDKTPDQLQFAFMLWTREAVQGLIEHKYQIKMPLSTVSGYLKRWGFTPQKPKLQSYKQQPEAVQKWIDEKYPEIVQQAKQEKAEIHWGDETSIRSQDQVGRGFSPKGQTPVLKTHGSRFSVNMVSSITNKGVMRFMLFSGSMNAVMFIKFLRRLVKGREQKIYLILDNSRVHHAKLVKKWVKKHEEKVALFFLPTYSPEYNPDEFLNNTLKSKLKAGPKAQNVKSLMSSAQSILKSLQNSPDIIRSFFRVETTMYAAG